VGAADRLTRVVAVIVILALVAWLVLPLVQELAF
jgi:hypothetical protein